MGDNEATGHWISYSSGPGGMDHLSAEDRAQVEKREAAKRARQGRLLCEVHVRVYEHADGGMWVSFPDDAVLGPDSEPEQVALAVARAQEQLGRWR